MESIAEKYPEIKNEKLHIHSLESFGTHDGPGIRFVVFTQGCQFKCLYCHNPDTIALQGGKNMDFETIIHHVLSQRGYFKSGGGLTVSGGEPLLHSKQLTKLFRALKKENIHIAVDTNGAVLSEDVKGMLGYVDLVLLDVKQIDSEKHRRLTGLSNLNTLKFAAYLNETEKPVWLRYVLVPGISDDRTDIENWAKYFAPMKNIRRVEILPYHKLGVHKWEKLSMEYRLKDTPPPTKEQCEDAKNILQKYFNVEVRVN